MKLSLLALCLACLMMFLGCAVSCKKSTISQIVPTIQTTVSPERKYAHVINYIDENEQETGQCTGTTIGPHAILTALHCDPLGKRLTIRLDLATNDYHVVKGYIDGRDHLIIILDGPAFTNIAPFKFRPAVMGEHVFTYGFGGWSYPSHRYDGHIIADVDGGDDSDVDKAAGIINFSFAPIPGDSGSAIYGDDGSIVGLITYSRHRKGETTYGTGFELNFRQEIYDAISQ